MNLRQHKRRNYGRWVFIGSMCGDDNWYIHPGLYELHYGQQKNAWPKVHIGALEQEVT